MATTAPISGHCTASRMVVAASTKADGRSARSSVSFSWSIAHMPRVTLRITEPEKLLACQSVENRCTRANVSCAMSCIMPSDSGITPIQP